MIRHEDLDDILKEMSEMESNLSGFMVSNLPNLSGEAISYLSRARKELFEALWAECNAREVDFDDVRPFFEWQDEAREEHIKKEFRRRKEEYGGVSRPCKEPVSRPCKEPKGWEAVVLGKEGGSH